MKLSEIISEELIDITNIMSYRPDGFDSGIVNEREDVDKIEIINKIIDTIHGLYRNNDYNIIEDSSGFIVKFDLRDYFSGLFVCFSALKFEKVGGTYYGTKDNKTQPSEIKTNLGISQPIIWIYNANIRIENGKFKISYNQDTLAHELAHYYDDMVGNRLFTSKSYDVNDYINNPTEYNAYMIQMLRKYFVTNPLNELGSFNEFRSKFFFDNQYNRKFYNHLEDKFRRKFMNRLYAFYVKLKERQNENNLNESYDDDNIMYDLFDMRDDIKSKLFYEFLYENNQDFTKPVKWYYLNPNLIKSIWEYYIKYKEVRNIKGLELIERIMIINTLKISVIGELEGKTRANPDEDFDENFDGLIEEFINSGKLHDNNMTNYFQSIVDEDQDSETNAAAIKENLEHKFWYYFGNGHSSDYGTKPLETLLIQLMKNKTYEEKLITIDKMLNVIHHTSDLAANFVRGGSYALSDISGYSVPDENGWGDTQSAISGKYKLSDYR